MEKTGELTHVYTADVDGKQNEQSEAKVKSQIGLDSVHYSHAADDYRQSKKLMKFVIYSYIGCKADSEEKSGVKI
jgi:hypothetical protein